MDSLQSRREDVGGEVGRVTCTSDRRFNLVSQWCLALGGETIGFDSVRVTASTSWPPVAVASLLFIITLASQDLRTANMSHQMVDYEEEMMKLWGLVNELSGICASRDLANVQSSSQTTVRWLNNSSRVPTTSR